MSSAKLLKEEQYVFLRITQSKFNFFSTKFEYFSPTFFFVFFFFFFFFSSSSSSSSSLFFLEPISSLLIVNVQIGRRIVWCIALALIGTIFVGSLIAYMHVKQKDEIAMAQNFLGLLATTVMVVAQLLVYLVLLPIIKRCRDNRMPEFYHQLPHEEGSGLHPELAAVVEDEIITAKPRPKLSSRFARWLHDFFLPKGEQPYRSFVYVIRLINMVALAVLLPFLVYNVITGRIMAPCEIPWDSS